MRDTRWRVPLALAVVCIGCIVAAGINSLSPAHAQTEMTSFFVVMNEQADLSTSRITPDPLVRRRRMVAALKATAHSSQAGLNAYLTARSISHRSFWLINAVLVDGDTELARRLAQRADVRRLVPNAKQRMHDPEPAPPRIEPYSTNTVEWNVAQVSAPAVWQNEETRGEGIVIAIADTGIHWDHPALIHHERIVAPLYTYYFPWVPADTGVKSTLTPHSTAPAAATPRIHDYAWHDAIVGDISGNGTNLCGFATKVPCDDFGHGTHVTGTAVGDDGAGNQIGVAPGAEWIGCRNMDGGVGKLSTYIDCFQWFLAPTRLDGSDPRPDLAPNIISNSWTCPPPSAEDCTDDVLDVMRDVIRTVRDAGIMVVAAAGNSGPSCSTVQDPPAIYDESFTVGASTSADTLASFSSRGAVTRDGSYRLKPDLVAPGAGVRSSIVGGGYGYKSGTSMATPAVSGVVALLWSAVPHLQGDVELTERILRESAEARIDTTCGAPDPDGHPNNSWGWGIIDAASAVELAKTCPTTADFDADGAVTDVDVERMTDHIGEPVSYATAVYDLDGNSVIDEHDVKAVTSQRGEACQWPTSNSN